MVRQPATMQQAGPKHQQPTFRSDLLPSAFDSGACALRVADAQTLLCGVNNLFEVPKESYGLGIKKWKYLHQKHGTELLFGIDPEICVGSTSSGKAAPGAAAIVSNRVYEKTESELVAESRMEVDVVRKLRPRGREPSGLQPPDLIPRHHLHRPALEKARNAKGSASQDHLHE